MDKIKKLSLLDITCVSCVAEIESALSMIDGVSSVKVNFANRTATMQADNVGTEVLISTIESMGYGAYEIVNEEEDEKLKVEQEDKEYRSKLKHSSLALVLGIPLMIYGLYDGPTNLNSDIEQYTWITIGIITLFVLYGTGKHFFKGGFTALRNHRANMDLLIALGTGTAWLYSIIVVISPQSVPLEARHVYFEAALIILGLINLGQALELKAKGKTSQAIRRLLDLKVKTAIVVEDGIEIQRPIEAIQIDNVVRIRTGDKIPVDGVVIEGNSTVDESMLTGEPMPIYKKPGDRLSAGTINGQGTLLFKVDKIGKDTILAQIIELVSNAQNSKPPISHLADKVSSFFVPVVMMLSILTALFWYNFGPQPPLVYMIVTATSVLIIACPCALGLATPLSTMIGVGKAAEVGGLIRNGEALQKASEIDVLLLDKTGTITQGTPTVSNSFNFSEHDNEYIFSQVHALEAGSNHPLASALTKYCSDNLPLSSTPPAIENFMNIVGKGVTGTLNGNSLFLGNQQLMLDYGIDISQLSEVTNVWEHEANTIIYFAINKQPAAMFGLTDPIKADSLEAITSLKSKNIRVIMLTGDNYATAQAIAQQANIEEFSSDLLPEDKLSYVKELQGKGLVVGMVGDGINDAPALSLSDVGFAIGGGTDVAIESADITLIRGSLLAISDVILISKSTMVNIRQNLWGAFIYNVIGLPVAAGVLFPLFGWLLNPIVAGAAMSLSSLTVVTNANRLRLLSFNKKDTSKV